MGGALTESDARSIRITLFVLSGSAPHTDTVNTLMATKLAAALCHLNFRGLDHSLRSGKHRWAILPGVECVTATCEVHRGDFRVADRAAARWMQFVQNARCHFHLLFL